MDKLSIRPVEVVWRVVLPDNPQWTFDQWMALKDEIYDYLGTKPDMDKPGDPFWLTTEDETTAEELEQLIVAGVNKVQKQMED